MAISAERKAQLDQIIQQHKMGQNSPQPSSGITPERKAQLDQIIAQHKAQQTPQPEQKGGFFGNLLSSLAKPFEKTIATGAGALQGLGELGGAGIASIIGDQQKAQQMVKQAGETARTGGALGKLFNVKPIGYNQDTGADLGAVGGIKDILGTGAEIGSYLAPVGAIENIGSKTLPLASKVAGGVLGGAVGGGLASGGSELQQPESTIGSVATKATEGAAFGGALGGAFPLAGATAKGLKDAGLEALGKASGTSRQALEDVMNKPEVIKYIHEFGNDPNKLLSDALQSSKAGLENIVEKQKPEYLGELSKIKANPIDLQDGLNEIKGKITDALTNKDSGMGVGIIPQVDELGNKLNKLDFEKSTIVNANHQSVLERAFNDLMGWTDSSPAGLDKLKKRLGQIADNIPVTEKGGAKATIYQIKDAVSSLLKEKVPGYEQMVEKYGSTEQLLDEVTKALSLGKKASKETAIKKLQSALKQNNELRQQFIKTLEGASGEDILGKISASQLSSFTPRGLTGSLQGLTSLGAFSMANLPGLLAWLSVTSPRALAEVLSLLGKAGGVSQKAIPPFLRSKIINIVEKAGRQVGAKEIAD